MQIQRPVHWHQGLFLQPQHFQLLECSLQSLLVPMQTMQSPYFWGVGEVDIQKAALGTRSFGILKGSFLFPDGAYAVLPENAMIDARSFDESWIEGGKPLGVYLGLKKWNDEGENVTVVEPGEDLSKITTRFVSPADPDEVRDLHSGGPEGQVKRLYFALKIFWESEIDQLGDYVTIALARLERSGEEVVLSPEHIPPSVVLSASGTLVRIVKDIRDQITARGRQLEELKRQRGVQTAEFGARDMTYLLALRSLNRYIPLLFHFTEVRQVHPWTVFGTLRQLIGELSSFSERVNVLGQLSDGTPALPQYDHQSLGDCFASAQSLIARLLDEITAGPEYVIRLVYDGTYFAAELKPAIFDGNNRYYLVVRTEEDPKFVLQYLSGMSKLSAREHLPILIARALPGIGLEHLPVPPQELPRRASTLYFAVDHHHDQWAMVAKNQNIALYWDNAPDDLEIELMVVGRA